MLGYWDGWKFYQNETTLAAIRVYEGEAGKFNRIFAFADPGDEVKISSNRIYFPKFKAGFDDFDLSGHEVANMHHIVLYVADKGSDAQKDGKKYIEIRAYEDQEYIAREKKREEERKAESVKPVYTMEINGETKEAVDTFTVSNYTDYVHFEKAKQIEVNESVYLASDLNIVYNDEPLSDKFYGLKDVHDFVICAFKKRNEKEYLKAINKGSKLYVVKKEEEKDDFDFIYLTIGVFE